jgi:hypothetical protein
MPEYLALLTVTLPATFIHRGYLNFLWGRGRCWAHSRDEAPRPSRLAGNGGPRSSVADNDAQALVEGSTNSCRRTFGRKPAKFPRSARTIHKMLGE